MRDRVVTPESAMSRMDAARSTAPPHRVVTRAANRYGLLLALLIVDITLLLGAPTETSARLLVTPFVSATLVVGLLASEAGTRAVMIGVAAAVVVLLVVIGQAVLGWTGLVALTWFLLAALVVVTPLSIARDVLRARTVTLRTLLGAISVYVLIGLAFGILDIGIQDATGQFFAQPPSFHPTADFVYFSYIVLLTVGFGDLTPAGQFPRVATVLEAMIGQVFLVTAVARLVTLYPSAPASATAEDVGGADEPRGLSKPGMDS
jgi:Ion channel